MKNEVITFRKLVESIHNLSIDDKIELKNLIDHDITEEKKNEIIKNYNSAEKEFKLGKLKFSDDITILKKMLE